PQSSSLSPPQSSDPSEAASTSSTSSNSTQPLPNPLRRSARLRQLAPSHSPSELSTFFTAQRTLRFAPSVMTNPFTKSPSLSNPWNLDTKPPVPQVQKAASIRSAAREEAAAARVTQRLAEESRRFEEARARIMQEESERLAREDELSQAGGALGIPVDQGPGLPAEQSYSFTMSRRVEELKKQEQEIKAEREKLEEMRQMTASISISQEPLLVQPPVQHQLSYNKPKVPAPEKWDGERNYNKLENWIRLARGYLFALNMRESDQFTESSSPLHMYNLRMLFSSKETNGISPQDWFNQQVEGETPLSIEQLFKKMREEWYDDHAAEEAYKKYRAARQGSMTARDFGTFVKSLAGKCFDRRIDDADRISTFEMGLNSTYSDFLKKQAANLKSLGVFPKTFDEIIKIAAFGDGIDSVSSSLKKSSSSFSSSTTTNNSNQKNNRTNNLSSSGSPSSPSSPSSSSPSPSRSRLDPNSISWVNQAREWQKEHPLSTRAKWELLPGKPAGPHVRCFNCGEVAGHLSRSCPVSNIRKDPGKVIIAVISKLSTVPSSLSLSSSKIEEVSDSESGKANDE
ncbi:hypothetical protein JCM5350_008144, partial [Sporobolomyces pararoseus]